MAGKRIFKGSIFFWLFFLAFAFSGCEGCDGSEDDDGGAGFMLCADMDLDGVGAYYTYPWVIYPEPAQPCAAALDCDDDDPFRAAACDILIITSVAPTSVDEGLSYSYDITCLGTDPANPPALAVGAGDGCGGTLVDNGDGTGNYSFPTDESMGSGQCVLEIDCSDVPPSGAPTATETATVDINEVNQAPAWAPAPPDMCVAENEIVNEVNGSAADADLPNGIGTGGYIACSLDSDDCPFTVTVSGAGAGAADCAISFTAPAGAALCSVTVSVSDGVAPDISDGFSIRVNPGVIHVDGGVAAPGGPGVTWADAYSHPQYATDATCNVPGQQIWVKEGTYTRIGAVNTYVLTLAENVEIYGGFAGTETMLSQRTNVRAHPTILDGENQPCNVVRAYSNTVFDGFISRRGFADFNCSGEAGGGFYCSYVDNVSVDNCVFENCQTDSIGGGVAFWGCSGIISNSLIINNNSMGYGGGMGIIGSSPTVENCTFSGNSAYMGQAISIPWATSSPTIRNSIIWGNNSPFSPIEQDPGASPVFEYCIIEGGYAGGSNIIDLDPQFAAGTYGNYYLDQALSPAVDAGSATAAGLGMDTLTTDPLGALDSGVVDMGYHYPAP